MSIMKSLQGRLAAIRDQVRTWGLVLPRATGARGPVVQVYGPGRDGAMVLVGTLSQDGGDFVFRYDRRFAAQPGAEPISAFPDLEQLYTSAELWPFFAVRIPPLKRADVREFLQRRGVKPEQTLQVLGVLTRKSATNPYELRLEDGAPSGPTSEGAIPPKAPQPMT